MSKAKKLRFIKDYRLTRNKLRLNQQEFWSRIGVTQSGGSRYEAGRKVPLPVAILAHRVYVLNEAIDAKDYE